MSIINNGLLLAAEAAAAGAYEISRSLRFNSADSAYLNRTPASASNRKTWTWAGWVKRSKFDTYQTLFGAGTGGATEASLRFNIDNTIEFYAYTSGYNARLYTTQVFRDASAWYHVVAVFNTPAATADQRIRLYVNGSEITTFSNRTNPTQNYDGYVNNSISHTIGDAVSGASPRFLDGYLADVHFIDGQALDPTSFGEFDTNGVWQPIDASGLTYGTNGFHLPFSDNSGTTSTTLGKDAAGSNNWTPNNFSVAAGSGNDSLVDVPTASGTDTGAGGQVRGNYCTLNPLKNAGTLSNGNLDADFAAGAEKLCVGTFGMQTGKWYFEVTKTSGLYGTIGIANNLTTTASYVGQTANTWGYATDGNKYTNGSSSAYGSTWTSGDVIGVAFDADAGSLFFYKNGVVQNSGTAAFTSLTSGPYFPAVGNQNFACVCNFGSRPFAYSAPSGFKALCTTNLPTPTIADGSTAMDVKLWTGTGATNAITGLGFSPDMVWIKKRSGAADHNLVDSVRVGTRPYLLYPNLTNAENTSYTAAVQSLDSAGFTLGTDGDINASGATYAGWCWDAGSSTVTNTSGSISSQVRANASAGFSVVTYTGTGSNATVGHGLGAGVGMLIIKNRNSANEWVVGHTGITLGSGRLYLNTTDANDTAGASALWNSTAATSSVFSVGTNSKVNSSGGTYVAYVFSPVAGYSSAFSYTGNGSSDGPMVFLGFRPRLILAKQSSASGENWFLIDSARGPYNVVDKLLKPNSSVSEETYSQVDFLSNGFKIRNTGTGMNANGATMIGFAWAEHPFQTARAR